MVNGRIFDDKVTELFVRKHRASISDEAEPVIGVRSPSQHGVVLNPIDRHERNDLRLSTVCKSLTVGNKPLTLRHLVFRLPFG